MKTLVKKAALDLIEQNGSTTTLEVKQELINTEPVYYWKQNFISATLAELAADGELEYADTGVFRIYSLPAPSTSLPSTLASYFGMISQPVSAAVSAAAARYKKVPLSKRNVVKVNLRDLAKLVEDNAGKFITLTHTKRTTGDKNTMNCQVLKDKTALGQLQVKEQGQLKTIYPSDLLEVRLQGTVYQLK